MNPIELKELLRYPATLEDLREIRAVICDLGPVEFAQVLNSPEYKAWRTEYAEHNRLLYRAEAGINAARRARRDAMLLDSVKRLIEENTSCT